MNILIALLSAVALTSSAQPFQYLNLAQIQAQQAAVPVPEPTGTPTTPAADPIESIDRSAWKGMTLDQWRACDSWRKDALQNPNKVRTSEIRDTDGNVWTQVGLPWTAAGANPPATGWNWTLCAADHLIFLRSQMWGPLARFKLSSDRKEMILWTGPMSHSTYHDPTDMFYWRVRADEVISTAPSVSVVCVDNLAWLWAAVDKNMPMVGFRTSDNKMLQPSDLPAILQLIDSEGLLGPASPYADPQVRAAVAARATNVMKLGGPYTRALFRRKMVYILNSTEIDDDLVPQHELGHIDAPISDFLPSRDD